MEYVAVKPQPETSQPGGLSLSDRVNALLKQSEYFRRLEEADPDLAAQTARKLKSFADVSELAEYIGAQYSELLKLKESKYGTVARVLGEVDVLVSASDTTQSVEEPTEFRSSYPDSRPAVPFSIPWNSDRAMLRLEEMKLPSSVSHFVPESAVEAINEQARRHVAWPKILEQVQQDLSDLRSIEKTFLQLRNQVSQAIAREQVETDWHGTVNKLKTAPSVDTDWQRAFAICLSRRWAERCGQLLEASSAWPPIQKLLGEQFAGAVKAISVGAYKSPDLRATLGYFLDDSERAELLDDECKAQLLVLRGRVSLGYRSAEGDAQGSFAEAMRLAPNLPDVYHEFAVLSESQQKWDDALAWHERTINALINDADPVESLRGLLGPLSGRACYILAERLWKVNSDKALEAIDLALREGIRGPSPQNLALSLKATLLRNADKKSDAAVAFFEAGKAFEDSGDAASAMIAYEDAIELDDSKPEASWRLADVYRRISLSEIAKDKKAEFIQKGINVWDTCAIKAPPSHDMCWAYVGRALLAECEANNLPIEGWRNRIDRYWQAIAFLESRWLVETLPPRSSDWAILGNMFNSLSLGRNALVATHMACELNPDDQYASLQRLYVLCDVGDFVAADLQWEHCQGLLEDEKELLRIRAYIRYHQLRFDDALRDLDEVIEAEGESVSVWNLRMRAQTLLRKGDVVRAQEDYRRIYERCDLEDLNNSDAYSEAAFELGRMTDAIAWQSRDVVIRDPLTRSTALMAMGLMAVRLGQEKVGWKSIEDGIVQARNRRELIGLRLDCAEVSGTGGSQDARAVTPQLSSEDRTRIYSLIDSRMNALPDVNTLEEEAWLGQEIDDALDRFRDIEGDRTWCEVGVMAAKARVYATQLRFGDAMDIYRKLGKWRLPSNQLAFPEAEHGVQKCMRGSRIKIDAVFGSDGGNPSSAQYADAERDGRKLLEYVRGYTIVDVQETAELHSSIAVALLGQGKNGEALGSLADALRTFRGDGEADPGARLGSALKKRVNSVEQFWMIHDVLRDASTGDCGEMLADLTAAQYSLMGYLDQEYELGAMDPEPEYLPILVEIGNALVPKDTSTKVWSLFRHHIPALRKKIEDEFGVAIPGIRVRAMEEDSQKRLGSKGYRIFLDNDQRCVREHGSCKVRGSAANTLPPQLRTNELAGERENRMFNAFSRSAYLLHIDDRRTRHSFVIPSPEVATAMVREAKAGVAPDATDAEPGYLRQAKVAIENNLLVFAGIEETERLLQTWAEADQSTMELEAIMGDPEMRFVFGRVLREMARAKLPLGPAPDMVKAFCEAMKKPRKVGPIVNDIGGRLKWHTKVSEVPESATVLPSRMEELAVAFEGPPSSDLSLELHIRTEMLREITLQRSDVERHMFADMRKRIGEQWGVGFPDINFVLDDALAPNDYGLVIDGQMVTARGGPVQCRGALEDDLTGSFHRMLPDAYLRTRVEAIGEELPKLVERFQEKVSPSQYGPVLRGFLFERMPLHNMRSIMEAILDFEGDRADTLALYQFAKKRLELNRTRDVGELANDVVSIVSHFAESVRDKLREIRSN